MPKNSEIRKREDIMLAGHVSDLDWEPRTEEQIAKDLFKGSDPNKIIDAFEAQLGIPQKTETPANQVYKCVFLKPSSDEDDRLLLQKFYNNPKQYQVIHRSDNWTHGGHLSIFLEYFENMDIHEEPTE